MAKAKKRATRATGVKKTWFLILAPKLFNSQVVGETLVAEPSKSIGKLVPVNLTSLTGDMRRQNIQIIFKIDNATGSKFYTEIVGYEMLASSLKRLVRRGKNKIDYSFTASTAEGNKVRIKVIMITRGMTKLSSLTGLRKACEENVKRILSQMNYGNLVDDVIHHNIQSNLKKLLNKIYPLKICEIRYMRLLKKGKKPEKAVKKEAPKKIAKQKEVKKSA